MSVEYRPPTVGDTIWAVGGTALFLAILYGVAALIGGVATVDVAMKDATAAMKAADSTLSDSAAKDAALETPEVSAAYGRAWWRWWGPSLALIVGGLILTFVGMGLAGHSRHPR